MPKRLQLRRTKGWRKPPGSVVISRPSIYGSPFPADEFGGAAESVELYELYLDAKWDLLEPRLNRHLDTVQASCLVRDLKTRQKAVMDNLIDLRWKDLLCWCPIDKPCHGNTLLRRANV